MPPIQYNEHTWLDYEHKPIFASSNAITGTKYVTEIYLLQGRSRYPLGQVNGKADDELVRAYFGEVMNQQTEKKYGQSSTLLLTRKQLTPVRDRARGFSNISRDKLRPQTNR